MTTVDIFLLLVPSIKTLHTMSAIVTETLDTGKKLALPFQQTGSNIVQPAEPEKRPLARSGGLEDGVEFWQALVARIYRFLPTLSA